MPRKGNAPQYYWYQKLRVLKEEGGEFTPQFQFWSGVIGGADYQDLMDVDELCADEVPQQIDWTIENLLLYDAHEILDAYARAVLYQRFCQQV